jgi:hypothetical protein
MSLRLVAGAALAGLMLTAVPHAQQTATAPAATATIEGSKRWIGHESEYEEFIRTAKVVKTMDTAVGVTHPKHCVFEAGGLTSGIVFKPLQPGRIQGYFESYKSEIAAYELDKLLGMGMVPPTVERKIDGQTGSVQMWVDDVVLVKSKDTTKAPDIGAWNRQVFRQRIFDDLIANIDRNAGNLLLDEAWNLILIDHSRAFTSAMTMPFPLTRIDKAFYEKLKSLDEATLNQHLGKLLFDGPKPLLKRRDKIIEHFDEQIAKYGEAAVLTP